MTGFTSFDTHSLTTKAVYTLKNHFFSVNANKFFVKTKLISRIPLFSLTILASHPHKNRKSRSRWLLKFPHPASVFSPHPEYHHEKYPNPAPNKNINLLDYCIFAAVSVKKGQKARFLRPTSSIITLAKEKERRNRKRGEEERRRITTAMIALLTSMLATFFRKKNPA